MKLISAFWDFLEEHEFQKQNVSVKLCTIGFANANKLKDHNL